MSCLMDQRTRVSLRTGVQSAGVYSPSQMDVDMKANGLMVNLMVLESSRGKTAKGILPKFTFRNHAQSQLEYQLYVISSTWLNVYRVRASCAARYIFKLNLEHEFHLDVQV
jgi:hypothetical protein